MLIAEKIRLKIEHSGIPELFIFLGFIAAIIFYLLNINILTVMDMVVGSILLVIILRAIVNIMIGFTTSLEEIGDIEENMHFQNSYDKLEVALSDLILQETTKSATKGKIEK
jgi:hypothetical protein